VHNEHDVHLSYWNKKLAGTNGFLPLPADQQVSDPSIDYKVGRKPFMIPRAVSNSLQQLSNECNTTLFVAILATFKLFLMRYSGSTDLTVATFTNTLLMLRSQLSSEMTTTELLSLEETTLLEAISHQNLPMDTLKKELGIKDTALFNTMFLMQDKTRVERQEPPLQVIEEQIEKTDICLRVVIDFDGISAEFLYDNNRFSHAIIRQMNVHFLNLLANFSDDVEQELGSIPMLTAEEQHQLVIENNSHCNISQDGSLAEQIQAAFEFSGTALLYSGSGAMRSAELKRKTDIVLHLLNSKELPDGSRIGVVGFSDTEWLVNAIAVLRAGHIILPLPAYELPKTLLNQIQAAKPVLLLGDQTVRSTLEVLGQKSTIAAICSSDSSVTMETEDEQQTKISGGCLIPTSFENQPTFLYVESNRLLQGITSRIQFIDLKENDVCSRYTDNNLLQLLIPTLAALVSKSVLILRQENTRPTDQPDPTILELNKERIHLNENNQVRLVSISDPEDADPADLQKLYPKAQIEHQVISRFSPDRITRHPYLPMTINNRFSGGFSSGCVPVYVLDKEGRVSPPGVWGTLCFGGMLVVNSEEMNQIDLIYKDKFSREENACIVNSKVIARYRADFSIELQKQS